MGRSQFAGLLVLIADNEKEAAQQQEKLQQVGYTVILAPDARAGMHAFKQHRPDAVLYALTYELDNVALFRAIKKLPGSKKTPSFFLVSQNDHAAIREAFQEGVQSVILKPVNWLTAVRQIANAIEAVQNRHELAKNKMILKSAEHMAKIGTWEFDLYREELYCSAHLYRILGMSPHDNVPFRKQLLERVHDEDYRALRKISDEGISQSSPYEIEFRIIRENERIQYLRETTEVLYGKDGEPESILGMIKDITNICVAEKQNYQLAHFDHLTGLPNRVLLKKHLELAVENAKRDGDRLAILVLGIDNFREMNDTLGHDAGDRLLKISAGRLLDSLRSSDCIGHSDDAHHQSLSRLGGDEFTVLLLNDIDETNIRRVAERIMEEMQKPCMLGNIEIRISVSAGAAVFPGDGLDAAALLKNAESAMNEAKQTAGSKFCFYEKSLNERSLKKLTIERELRLAIENDELEVYYQPKVSAANSRITSAEALLRWHHPTLGNIPPSDFIPIAETSDLIISIGRWVLETACQQTKRWYDAGYKDFSIAVNLSARQFSTDIVETVKEVVERIGLPARALELELTEGLLMTNDAQTMKTLTGLHDYGIKLSVDDFGTGYSSLRYLSQFPLHALKVDRSFVMKIMEKESDALITKAIISLAHNLNLQVVAEGVEAPEQLEALAVEGCDLIQGYLASKPVCAADFTVLLENGVDIFQGLE